jgi:hypothetical protein
VSASVQRQAEEELELQRQVEEPVVQRQDEAPEEMEEEPEAAG